MTKQPVSPKKIIAAFDFDGTITTRDAFLPFLIKAFGRSRVLAAFLALGWQGIGVWCKLVSRDRFKELIVARLFTGESMERLTKVGLLHATEIATWCRPAARERIAWHKENGHRLIMVSASLDIYLAPVAQQLGFDDLLCTRLEQNDQVATGRLIGTNCRAAEKVSRLEQLLSAPLSDFEVYAYGDTAGDAEMLAAADHPSYKPFTD